MSPRSTAAQIFCVFFALFGIPLNMVVLNRVGKYMLASMRNLADFLEEKSGRRVRPSQNFTLAGEVFFSFLTADHLNPLVYPEAQPCFRPPDVPCLRRSALLPGADSYIPAAGRLDLLSSSILLLHHPQHYWLRGLRGRYGAALLWTTLNRKTINTLTFFLE